MYEIEKVLSLADRHLWYLIDEGELIEHIRNILEERNKYREAIQLAIKHIQGKGEIFSERVPAAVVDQLEKCLTE